MHYVQQGYKMEWWFVCHLNVTPVTLFELNHTHFQNLYTPKSNIVWSEEQIVWSEELHLNIIAKNISPKALW